MGVLDGKGAVVTGGSRGIGRAIVEQLAGDGAVVVFNYAHSSDAAAAVERVVGEAGGRAHAVQLDLAEPDAVDELMAAASEHLAGLDILVNNAALDLTVGPIADTEEQLWDLTMTVNAKSAFLTTRHAARTMNDDGRIINISTVNTRLPAAGIADLRRQQRRNRAAHQGCRDRARRPRYHGQRGLPRRDRHRSAPARQPRGCARPDRHADPARATRTTRRHRRRRLPTRGPRGPLAYRPDHLRIRRALRSPRHGPIDDRSPGQIPREPRSGPRPVSFPARNCLIPRLFIPAAARGATLSILATIVK